MCSSGPVRSSDTLVLHMVRLAGLDRDDTPVVLVAEGYAEAGVQHCPRGSCEFDSPGSLGTSVRSLRAMTTKQQRFTRSRPTCE